MTTSTESFGHVLKINWARDHLQQLERQMRAWFDGKRRFAFSVEPDPNMPSKWLVKLTADKIPLRPYSLIIGDIVNNLRSSLDYIAYELAIAHSKVLTKKQARSCQFPIVGDEDRNGVGGAGAKNWKTNSSTIQCIDPNAQAVIEGVQPFKLGGDFREHPLWHLQELSNINKHRFLHIAAACATPITIQDCILDPQSLLLKIPIAADETPTVVAELKGIRTIDPNKTVDMNVSAEIRLAFADGPMRPLLVLEALGRIHQFVRKEVLLPLEQFIIV